MRQLTAGMSPDEVRATLGSYFDGAWAIDFDSGPSGSVYTQYVLKSGYNLMLTYDGRHKPGRLVRATLDGGESHFVKITRE